VPPVGHARWDNFRVAVERAHKACEASDNKALDHFRDVTKMIALAKGAERLVEDGELRQ